MQPPRGPSIFGGPPQETILWCRSPPYPLRPELGSGCIPLSDTPGAYTSTVYLMTGFQNGRRLNWIQKCWTQSDFPTFQQELIFHTAIQKKDRLPCVPTLLQAWSTADGYCLAMEPPHHVGWHCATNTLSKEEKQAILDAYTLLESHGILHGFTRLDDILIGDDGKVTIVNFTAASALRPYTSLPTYTEKDRDAERCRLLAALNAECSASSQPTEPKRFEIPARMQINDSESRKREWWGGFSSGDYQYTFPSTSSKPPHTTAHESPAQTVYYTTQRGFISQTLPPRTPAKKKVRFEYGTMDSHLWNHAREYVHKPALCRMAKQIDLERCKQTPEGQQECVTRPMNAPGETHSAPSPSKLSKRSSMQEPATQSSSPRPSSSTSSTPTSPRQATLGIPPEKAQRRRPLDSSNACSDDAGPSFTYEEPPPSCNSTTPDEGAELDEGLAIVITSPTGQQHVWGAPANILGKINLLLGNLGARCSTPVPQAVPTARKRKAGDDGGDSDPEPVVRREEISTMPPAAVQDTAAVGRQRDDRDSRKTTGEAQPSLLPHAQTNLATRTGDATSSATRSALKRKAGDNSSDTRSVRAKS